eukprot:Skav224044  [mRNA]  locus=scaffold2030:89303:94215:- [translate_table: standard]
MQPSVGSGRTPLEKARERGHTEIVRFLEANLTRAVREGDTAWAEPTRCAAMALVKTPTLQGMLNCWCPYEGRQLRDSSTTVFSFDATATQLRWIFEWCRKETWKSLWILYGRSILSLFCIVDAITKCQKFVY